MPITYVRHIPPPPLNAYIDYFFYLDGAMTYPREKSLSVPAAVLIINFSGAVKASNICQHEAASVWAESWWMGPWSIYHLVDWPTHVQQVGVAFKAGGAYPFLQLPLSEVHNQYVALDNVWRRQAAEIRERLYAARTVEAKFALLEQILVARLNEAPQDLKTVDYAVGKIIEQSGLVSIKDLSDSIGISQNHLLKQFNQIVGFSPKELAKHYRLRAVLRSTNPTQLIDWTHIALNFGFYDLSHLNKDFVAFTGHNPTQYLKLFRQNLQDNPLSLQLPRLLPID